MKKLIFLALLSSTALFTGCSLLASEDGSITVPSDIKSADAKHYKTIGEEFKTYFILDSTLTSEKEMKFNRTLDLWRTSGSTWSTYEILIGPDDSGPYVVYYKNDPTLTNLDKTAREINIDSWEINLTARLGDAPWNEGENN